MIITPKFWHKKSFISFALLPFGFFYFMIGKLRQKFGKKFAFKNKFVLCVGNITIGGTGKTPTVIALIKELQQTHSVCVLTKGYKRRTTGFLKAQSYHTYHQIGDEPCIIAKFCQVYLYSSLQDLEKNHNQITESVIIIDDGLQNNIFKNFAITIIGRNGTYNGLPFPAGGMRESVASALKKTSAILYTSNKTIECQNIEEYAAIQTFKCNAPLNTKYIAFSGLGDNEKFMKSLHKSGYSVAKFIEFADHHPYTQNEIQDILETAQKFNCKIITTEKDFIKIPKELQENIFVFYKEYRLPDSLISKIKQEIYKSL